MKRCLDNIYTKTYTYINVCTVGPPNNGRTRSEAFVLCREITLISEVAIQSHINHQTEYVCIYILQPLKLRLNRYL